MTGDQTISETVREVLQELHYEKQRRLVGFYPSQSLRLLMRDLRIGDADVIRLDARRRVNENAMNIPWFGYEQIKPYVDAVEHRRDEVKLKFDKKPHGQFDWAAMKNWLDETENEAVYDLPVYEIVFKFEDDNLERKMWNFLERACEKWDDWEMWDRGEFQQPFYARMKSSPAGSPNIKNAIEAHNPKRYHLNGDETDEEGNRGMGFPYRTLDLVAIWSYRAFIDSKNPVVGNVYTMRDIEERFVNHSKKTDRAYGMVNSPSCISPWASGFEQAASQKKFEWSEEGEWVQVG